MLGTMDFVGQQDDSSVRTAPAPRQKPAPAVGILIGMGISIPLWFVVGGLVWLTRTRLNTVLDAVLAWAAAIVRVS